ncbi:uncharacterized protein HMPREF1541_04386 [Cyphellophora europaea CBS 101466]|uniref:Cytochrome P450 n=1 Tax=Cyphellophora europaea (strain CBS 101466) TaxID=1220924 RepID=W2RUB6_CYPE1|nr:uncharacterized protein HMPREF1541_04386 [Cyphellophora europaea CBS 101466]ETN40111.1 hypothetical protein HMPREF1541_04386 [Cyphellophora europaea CBS 101466]
MQLSTLVLLAAIPLYFLVRSVHRNIQFRRFSRLNNASAPPMLPSSVLTLHLDWLITAIRMATSHSMIAHFRSLFTTLQISTLSEPPVLLGLLGSSAIVTQDKENIKALLAMHVDDYAIEPVRHELHPLLGQGIFNSDGEKWALMRANLRPWFGRGSIRKSSKKGQRSDLHHALRGMEGLDLYDLAGRSEKPVQKLLESLRAQWTNGRTVDLSPLFFHLMFDTSTGMTFATPSAPPSPSAYPEETAELEAYRNARTWHRLGGWGIGVPKNVPHTDTMSVSDFEAVFDRAFLWLAESNIEVMGVRMPNESFFRDCEIIKSYLATQVDAAILRRDTEKSRAKVEGSQGATQKPLGALIDHLAALEPPMARDDIRDEALHILFAARDTTAGTMCDLFWLLSRHQGVLTRLRTEILTHFPQGGSPEEITFERTKQLLYLSAVIKETIRLHPVLPFNAKAAVKDTILPRGGGPDGKGKVAVRKGTHIVWFTYGLHRNEKVYGADVDAMRPERWLDGRDVDADDKDWLDTGHGDENGALGADVRSPTTPGAPGTAPKGIRPGWAYIPFNGGPRTCIGQQFALGTLSYVTVRVLQELEREGLRMVSRDADPWTEKFSLTAKNLNGCKVAFVREEDGLKEC